MFWNGSWKVKNSFKSVSLVKLLYLYNTTTMKRIISIDEYFEVLPHDPHGFDRDEDGIGCES